MAEYSEKYQMAQNAIQKAIDDFNRQCRKVLHQKQIVNVSDDGFWLTRRYEHQEELTPWDDKSVLSIKEALEDTEHLISRVAFRSEEELSIMSPERDKCRPWSRDEVDIIRMALNGWIQHQDQDLPKPSFVSDLPKGNGVISGAQLTKNLEDALNRNSAENASNTPDFILAGFLEDCLRAWDRASNSREKWYGGTKD
jgi:hypothetical protein